MEQFASQHTDFQYDITLSREDAIGTTRGYVHEIYKNAYVNKRENVKFYLCGWSKMIDEAVAILMIELGYDRTQIVYELYG
jgi:CDP-4-dehydro-6-deoxyglucose reductase